MSEHESTRVRGSCELFGEDERLIPTSLEELGYFDGQPIADLEQALESCFAALEKFVCKLDARAQSGADDARLPTTDELERQRDRYAKLVTDDYRTKLRSLQHVISAALWTGEVDEVDWAAARLIKDRDRRRWVELCRGFFPTGARQIVEQGGGYTFFRHLLSRIDARADSLNDEDVAEAIKQARRQRTSRPHAAAESLAARLACRCRAFGYTKLSVALTAFQKASRA